MGGGTKGVLFLKHLFDISPPTFDNISGVVDINPNKQSLFTPSTKIQIISPKQMFESCREGDTVLVLNPNYHNEINAEIQNNVNHSIDVVSF